MLKMTPMSNADFECFRQSSAADYVEQCRLTGLPSLAATQAETLASLDALLPQGAATPGHDLMVLQEQDGNRVGIIWFGEILEGNATSVFLYDLWIDPPWRRRGFAREALRLLEGEIKLRGIGSLSLNVFAHNEAAQALYRDVGFIPSEITMVRSL